MRCQISLGVEMMQGWIDLYEVDNDLAKEKLDALREVAPGAKIKRK